MKGKDTSKRIKDKDTYFSLLRRLLGPLTSDFRTYRLFISFFRHTNKVTDLSFKFSNEITHLLQVSFGKRDYER